VTQVLWILLAYLLGSIPFGLIIGHKVGGVDVREHGSKNIGATNVSRVLSKRWGILVFILDVLKGLGAVLIPRFIISDPLSAGFLALLGASAIIGHTFPVWLKFKGGKGVATSLGVFLGIAWLPTLITFGIWILTFIISRIISLSSLVAALVFPIMMAILTFKTPDFSVFFPISLGLSVFMFYTHRGNIKRLLKGEEKRII